MKFKLAVNYDRFALAQKFAAKTLINSIKSRKLFFKNVYEIGSGSGILTKLFIKNFSFENLILNDIYKSSFMENFNTQIGDILNVKLSDNFDLFISSSVFQWIDELEFLRNKLYDSLKDGGILAFSMFIDGNLSRLSDFTKQGLHYNSNSEIQKIFSRKFEILEIKSYEFIAVFSSLRELLIHLKETGVNNINGKFRLNKTSLMNLESHFSDKFELDYKFSILICRK